MAMKADSHPPSSPILSDSAVFGRNTHLWTAGFFVLLLVLQQCFLPIGWVLDIHSPDFNPMIFVPFILMGAAVVSLVKAVLLHRHWKKYGESTLVLAGNGRVVPGGPCRGVIRTERPLRTSEDYEVTMRCVEIYMPRSVGDTPRNQVHHVTAWEDTLILPSDEVDTSEGLAFAFDLPEVEPVESRLDVVPGRPYFRCKAAITLPGLKTKVITENVKPSGRTWWLELAANTEKGRFRTQFQVPVLEA